MSDIPYQAYRSKRHSRTTSTNSLRLSSTPPPASAAPSSPAPLPSGERQVISLEPFSDAISSIPQLGALFKFQLDSEQRNGGRQENTSHGPPVVSVATSPSESAPDTGNVRDHPVRDGPTTRPSAATLSLHQSTEPLAAGSSTPKVSSTFRRVPHRVSRSALPPSPLSSRSIHSPVHSRNPSTTSSSSPFPATSSPVPVDRRQSTSGPTIHSDVSYAVNPAVPSSEMPLAVTERRHRPSSRSADAPCLPSVTPTFPSQYNGSTVNSRSALTTPTNSRPATPPIIRSSAPYRVGFQPKGVYRPLTDDFIAIRRLKHDGEGPSAIKRVERTKLERRLEKLIALHFPRLSSNGQVSTASDSRNAKIGLPNKQPTIETRRLSTFDLASIRDATSIWRSMLGERSKDSLRDAEQRITPWQDDSSVNRCPLCDTSFHPLTNRKHHCRLCGKIMCSLPPKRPHRPVACSLLFVVDSQSSIVEEVGEGVDYGVKRRRIISHDKSLITETGQDDEDDKFLRGIRICRECRPTLLRKKHHQETLHVPLFFHLHEILIGLEREIEVALPQFQELLLTLGHNDQPTKDASSMRKRLLEAFAQYDSLSKQIYQLPCPNGSKSSQHRVQMAVLARANIFLQKKMFPLKSLSTTALPTDVPQTSLPTETVTQRTLDLELAQQLQPLLEQEALLETFIEEAEIHRKFEDVKSLRTNLEEIRVEIQRISSLEVSRHS
ncbi:hypothetical protein AX17_003386 [Amanita inopinata Kibby_2008]|nr:hypothetical protein AX17_003386 [Amanita inopinata Kibby_2008]